MKRMYGLGDESKTIILTTNTKKTYNRHQKLFYIYKKCFFFSGSPVKAEDLPGCLVGDMADPRPLHFRRRPDRQNQFRSLVTNFVAHTGKDIVARYAIPKANIQAAAQDLDY